ncbi:hypothetical protein LEP1GSC123_3728 [Leptospira borgpetersenii str. 200701203]|uniref:Transposase DDE domain protein n=1 Tax=Leptospira borgpetersenii str. 200701203 TaxID=1193007 RepID=M3H2V5_LEPBO|nr:hypothetical protein LEP1GSC123_3728 [Leptospira borgpetersenii str. 200701203]
MYKTKINSNPKILSNCLRKRNRKFQFNLSEVATIVAYFLSNTCMGKCSGISFIDSTILWSMRQQKNSFS